MYELKTNEKVKITVTVHGFDSITEDYVGILERYGREGDEYVFAVRFKHQTIRFYEGDIVRIQNV